MIEWVSVKERDYQNIAKDVTYILEERGATHAFFNHHNTIQTELLILVRLGMVTLAAQVHV